jgi:Ca2+-binding EF-hand superfamily protein
MSSIGSVGGMMSAMLTGPGSPAGRAGRPDPSAMADKMFSRIDGNGDGGIDKGELTSALGRFSPKDGSSDATATADKMFAAFDADGSGSISQQETRTGLENLKQQLESQFQQMRAGDAGPPPPTTGGGNDPFGRMDTDGSGGLSTTEFGAVAQTTSQSAMLEKLFSKIDKDGDGSVTRAESDQWRKALDKVRPSEGGGQSAPSFDPVDGLMAMVAQQYASSAQAATTASSLQATA